MLIEEKVNNLIKELKENKVDFGMQDISKHFNILLIYNDEVSRFTYFNEHPIIHIKHSDLMQEWKDFTLQLGHFFFYDTNQRHVIDKNNDITEQAIYKFSLLMQMPECEIEKYSLFTPQALINHFNVDYTSAHRRLCYLNAWYASESWCEV
ncbi:MAG: hypothetical protein QP798_07040 [Staphylococcus simulans]|uniref:hypothetical protein n=1 Tax=Staphylococcus simulans TaxID=1286 RepID=UPI00255255A5|nr:hypothetical protein [Staphylococcus simulans]MDK7927116.1 hypothetical protein [Staphylococcus simulans]MDK8315685.1 hypothetical protein [Staphylococcus simulans]